MAYPHGCPGENGHLLRVQRRDARGGRDLCLSKLVFFSHLQDFLNEFKLTCWSGSFSVGWRRRGWVEVGVQEEGRGHSNGGWSFRRR